MQDSGAQAPSPITAGLRVIMRHDYQHDALVVDEKVFIDMCDAIDSDHSKCETTLGDAIREGHEWADSYERLKAERDRALAELDRVQGELSDTFSEAYDKGYDDGFASADDWMAQNEDAMAEHGWVRRNKEHVISHTTVEVTPHIDWPRMADELDEFAKIVRGMASCIPTRQMKQSSPTSSPSCAR